MEIVALDGVKLIVLMSAGGVFALIGLLFMFRAKQEGGSARLELLGQKFEASSAGIIVFLIGAAFLATPLFVPEKQASAPVFTPSAPDRQGVTPADAANDRPDQSAPVPQPRKEKQEIEPNQSVSEATAIEVGQTVLGESKADDADWFVLQAMPEGKRELNTSARVFGDRGCAYVDVLDAEENELGGDVVCYGDRESWNVSIVTGTYFVRVKGTERLVYEFVLEYR